MIRSLVLLAALLLAACPASAAPRPTLLFSDLVSGPASGNSDSSQPGQVAGTDGAIVTVWGHHLGDTQGSSSVRVGGQVARVYTWGRATAPADLYTRHRMQMVAFQIPHTLASGATTIQFTVNGVTSNTLPFTVRPGAIHFVKTTGNDDTGDGSWSSPWRTLDNLANTGALDKIAVGDIVYVGDGVQHRVQAGDRAAIDLGPAGTAAAPKAIIGYPGATAAIGDSLLEKAYALWVSGFGPTSGWVIAKLQLSASADAADMFHDFRVIGNRITAPRGDGPTGAVAGQGNNLYLLGNELTNIGFPATSKLYHPIYIQSAEACSGPRLPLERNREIAWNYLHDNLAYDGINVYRECGSSAFMVDHRVHDNYIANQTGVGIRIGDYVTGENWIYNNIVFQAGLGPEPPGDYAMHVPLHIHAGWEDTTTVLHVYNNTVYGGGFTGGQAWSSSMVGFATAHPYALDFRNNIVVSSIPGIAYLNPSLDTPPPSVQRNLWFGAGASPAWDSDPLSAAPQFVNATTGDFTLHSTSPARDAAIPAVGTLSLPVPALDFYSTPRTSGGRADLGAVEFSDSSGTGGVIEQPGAGFAVSPNPASAAVAVRLSNLDGVSALTLHDLSGRVVSSVVPNAATFTFNAAGFRPGVYLVRYRTQTRLLVLVR